MTSVASSGSGDHARTSAAWWTRLCRTSEIWWTRNAGRVAIEAACASRCAEMIAFARAHSSFYREAWRDLPAHGLTLAQLPIVNKHRLMERFDDWVTDPALNRADVEEFLADRTHIGDFYRNRYVIWKSSGTTGEPGIFVQDEEALTTYDALIGAQLQAVQLAGRYAWGLLAQGGRAALIAATGDHFASIASWQHVRSSSPWSNARVFSVMDPLPQLVSALNAYQPAFLASYPTMLAQLATEQAAGRLHIAPACLWSGGECLAPATHAMIERAFECTLINEYGSSECMSIAFGCSEGWLHVNADWVVLEPVDRNYGPTPPGERSHTVLLTNLANRVQPIIRYDLGDSVIAKPERCACGSPLPAVRAEGRRDAVVAMRDADRRTISLLPLALTTVVENATDLHRFQLVQQSPDRLALRLEPGAAEHRQQAWLAAAAALREYLARHSLANVQVVLDPQSPQLDPRSGKLHEVIVEAQCKPHVPGHA
jgi:putative adenylate-forming enzyme